MKKQLKAHLAAQLGVALVAMGLVFSTVESQAQVFPNGSYTNNFDPATHQSGSQWINTDNWGSLPIDPTTPDPLGGPTAASLKVVNDFSTGSRNVNVWGTFSGNAWDESLKVDLANFETVSFDIYMGTNNTPSAAGDFGTIGIGYQYSWGYYQFGRVVIPGAASNNWVHFTVPVDSSLPNAHTCPSLEFNINNDNPSNYPSTQQTVWIGNVVMKYTAQVIAPPPVGPLVKAVPGLTQFISAGPSHNNRVSVRTAQSGSFQLSWYDANFPVEYSFTIADFLPDATAGSWGYFVTLDITPEPLPNQGNLSPDWNNSSDLQFQIVSKGNKTANAGLSYKVNNPNSQSAWTDLVAPWTGLPVASAAGTWKLTFTDNTHITLTAPDGTFTNVILPSADAAYWNGQVGVYLSTKSAQDAVIGMRSTFSKFSISGVPDSFVEDFTKGYTNGGLTTPFLQLRSQVYGGGNTPNPPNQVFVPNGENFYWMSWGTPDTGLVPAMSSSLGSGADWNSLINGPLENNTNRFNLINTAEMSAPQGFFGLFKRDYVQLQVLWPGETNAPNTLTGKTGTPLPVDLGGPAGGLIPVEIYAVDSTWHIITSATSTLSITASDPSVLPTSASGTLSNGKFTENVQFTSGGSFIITAADTLNSSITNGISSSITVN
jgi:hypothetical protein